jgi:hypothetical protein
MGKQSAGKAEREDEPVSWVVWEARAHVARAAAVLALIFLLSAGVYFSLGDPRLSGLALLVLLIAVLPYYLPVRYTLDADGVQVDSLLGLRRKPWANLRVYFPDGEKGILLSPVVDYGLIARSRGIYLPLRENGVLAGEIVARHLRRGKVGDQ